MLLQSLERSPESDALRIMASGQISWLGWREGLTVEEAMPFIQEALQWAHEIDDSMIPLLIFVEARITGASGGAADVYVKRVKEALSLLKPEEHMGRAATLNASLSHAYGWAGLLREALAANNEAVQRLSNIDQFDHQFLGYNVEHWTRSLRARILIQLGRLSEAEEFLQMMIDASEVAPVDPTVQFIAHLGYVEIAWYSDDVLLAKKHATRVAEIARKHGSPYLRVFSVSCNGTLKYIAKDFIGALVDFTESLSFVRHARVAVDFEPEIMASLAECYLAAEQYERAVAIAIQTIDLAKQRTARLPEIRALISQGNALLAQYGAASVVDADVLLRRAEELIRITGAEFYMPGLEKAKERLLNVAA